ncbi:hypothetical protein ACQ4PT_045885 [Festuca glaucescens]
MIATVSHSTTAASAEFDRHKGVDWSKKGAIVAAASSVLAQFLWLSAMSCNLEGPVQTQMAVSALSSSLIGDPSKTRSDGRAVGWKRVFVQTDTGFVLAVQLDRGDNAHTVKRKLQLALNVPTEESSLTFGDHVLKNDLSSIRNDSPLLLTKTFMHRSSSTPCLSPTSKDLQQQRDRSGPIEVLVCPSRCSRAKQLVKDVARAIRNGVDPTPVNSGLGGAYYFRNSKGENAAIVKPNDEEPFAPNNPKGFTGRALGQPGLKRSVRVGETGFREVAAYLLDYGNFANVPPTVLVKISHPVFNVNESVSSTNKASLVLHELLARLPHFSSLLLMILMLVTLALQASLYLLFTGLVFLTSESSTLIDTVEIFCLPECLEDPYFEWIHWPQASIPFSEDELEYIANLDPVKDADILRVELPMIREACLRVLILSTIFLKEGASFGLCLAEIGEMMSSRIYRGG